MKLVIEIELGNDAMQTVTEAVHGIENAMYKVLDVHAPLEPGQLGSIRDVNGNTVGRWSVDR